MSRGRIFGMVLAGLALWTGPAFSASIQKQVDSQGVIRISNVKPRTASAPEIAANPPAPPEPGIASSCQPASVPQPPPKPDSADNASTSPPHVPASEKGNREAPEPAVPVKKAAFSPSPISVKQEATSKEVAAAGGGIRRYRDAQGVIHIENAAPEPSPLPQSDHRQAPALEVSGPREDHSPEPIPLPGLLPIKKASWSDSEVLARGRIIGQSQKEGIIRCYRDSKGVLHITNHTEPPEIPPRQAQRDQGSGRSRDGPELKPQRPPPSLAAAAPLIITRASWEDRTPPAPDPWLAAEAPGQIRRYRDAKGVWHIHSVEPELPAPAIPKARPRSLLSQAFASTLPEKGGVWPNTAAPFSSGGQVVAYKDKKGKLIITNPDPQALAGRGPPLSPAPHLQAIILEAAQAYGLPPPLIEAVIKVESNAVPWAVSPKGAMGLMQLMPGTAEFLGVKDPFSPRENVLGGSHYLRLLLNLFQESLPLALAAYNAGFQRVINCGHRIPEIKETQEFVAQVMERYYLAAQRADRPRL